MTKISITDTNPKERADLIKYVNDSKLNDHVKELLVNIIQTYFILLDKLQSAQITIHKLQTLCGFKSDKSKK